MTTPTASRTLKALLLCIALMPAWGWAAGSAVIQLDTEKSEIHWQDSHTVRMGSANADEYTLLKNGKVYSVYQDNGQPHVMELTGMVQAVGKMAQKMTGEYPDFGEVTKVSASGKTETIAGIEGEVYRITAKQAGGATETVDVVLTSDKRVVELTQAYLATAQTIIGKAASDNYLAALPAGKHGLLRSGDDYRLLSINASQPAAQLFSLPAKPQDMHKMLQDMGRQMQQSMQQMQQGMQQMQEQFKQMQQP